MLVLLDRDGVINVDSPNGANSIAEFTFLPRAIDAVAMLTQAGFKLAICTNQSAIGKGLLTVGELSDIHAYMCSKLRAEGGIIDMINFAPDHPDAPTARRKPASGMLHEALQHFGADPARTPMVGDALRDLEAAAALGCPRILVRTGKGSIIAAKGLPEALQPVTICDDLYAAAEHICREYR